MKNLVVVVADTLRRPESIRRFDFARDAPFLNDMVNSSVSFDNAVASSSWTVPSHWSLLHGLEPWRTGFRTAPKPASSRSDSLALRWREHGGVSVGLSQNERVSRRSGLMADYDHLVSEGLQRFRETAVTTSNVLDLVMGVSGRKLRKLRRKPTSVQSTVGRGISTACQATSVGAAWGVTRILYGMRRSHANLRPLARKLRSVGTAKPVHVTVNLMDAHEPYIRAGSARGTALESGRIPTANLSIHSRNLKEFCTDPDQLHDSYRMAVRDLDTSLQDLFRVLRRAGTLDDALVCLVSDHGQSLGENGFWGHGWSVHDELVRIPTYLWYSNPSSAEVRGSHVRDWVDHRHIHDILLDQFADSHSLGHSVEEATRRHGPALTYFRGRPFPGFNPGMRSPAYEELRVWNDSSDVEFTRNAADLRVVPVSRHGSNVSGLEDVATSVFRETARTLSESGAPGESAEVLQRLESWGYS